MEVSDEIEGVLNDASDDKVVLETIAVLPLSLKKRHGDESSKSELEDLAKRQTTLESQTKSKNESWDVMFERMCKYKQTYGDCLVPKRYAADPKLGTWVETQRIQYKKLERGGEYGEVVQPNNRLTEERLSRLENINFAWSAKRRRSPSIPGSKWPSLDERLLRKYDEQWDEFYGRLAKYKATYGSTLVPLKYNEDPELANWCEALRVLWSREYEDLSSRTNSEVMEDGVVEVVDSSFNDSGKVTEADLSEGVSRTHAEDQVYHASFEKNLSLSETTPSLVTKNSLLPDMPLVAPAALPPGNVFVDERPQINSPSKSKHDVIHSYDLAATMEGTWQTNEENTTIAVVTDAAAAAAQEALDEPNVMGDSKPAPKYLTLERKAKLDELGFVWCFLTKRGDVMWDDMFQKLLEYKEKNGNCLVPSRYELNPKLGKWVETQRYEYTKWQRNVAASSSQEARISDGSTASQLVGTSPSLNQERFRRLESINFEWKVKNKMKRYYDNQWEQMFDRLSEFKQEHGHCMVPKRYPPDTKLGTWIHTQRCQYRKMSYAAKGASEAASLTDSCTEVEDGQRLTDDRRIRLEELGFVWSVREVEKVMEPCRISRNSYDDQWDAMLESLAAYKGKYGHCLVPKRCKEDPKLGTWVDTQRVQYKKMKKKLEGTEAAASNQAVYRFTEERIRRLEDLGFVWSIRDDWQKHYDELKKFKKDHGHCNVPARYSNNRRLGIWVSAQRQQYKILMAGDESTQRSTPLTDKRIDQLNELGFTWAVRARDSLGESWSQRLKELQQYKKQYGDCLVPARYPPNPELGIWIGTQRTQYRLYMKAKEEGKQISNMTLMTEERLQQLNELGFVFNLRGGQDEKKDADTVDARMEEAKTETATNFATISDPATSTVDGNSTSVAPRAEAKAFSTLVCVATGRRNITPAVVSESVIPKGVEFMDSL